ncbi:hypothetical protein [Streptomyces sp. NPDC015131]|uniref:hypothetical protein n=1 Tax=Streptomyces sp. NPDC015131 TaxID=3364941 RepID=UPI003702702B
MRGLLTRLLSEEYRYPVALGLAHLGWWSTAIVVVLRAAEILPSQYGLITVCTIGLAIAATLALIRVRITNTLIVALHATVRSLVAISANAFVDTCIVGLDKRGRIESVDHADVIGWDNERLTGEDLQALLRPPAGGSRCIEPGATVNTAMVSQAGDVFDAKISVVCLEFGAPDGDCQVIATISPRNTLRE